MAVRDGTSAGAGTAVLGFTRVLAAVIVPFLVAAWWILYLRPEETGRLFAWPVGPPMTAMFLGAVYLGGAYFFVRVIIARTWEEVAGGFLPVAGFAALMGVATVLHWDRFTSGHVAFVAWAALYFTTPALVLAAWWLNQRRAAPAPGAAGSTGAAGGGELALPAGARRFAGTAGAAAVVLALAIFALPAPVLAVWPWELTPLTARVLAAMLLLGGAGLAVWRDPRWSSVRLLVEVAWVMLGLTLVAVVRARGDFEPANPLTAVFVAWLVAVLATTALAYKRMRPPPRSPGPAPA